VTHRGHQLWEKQRWVFGVYDLELKEGFIQLVEQRDAGRCCPLYNESSVQAQPSGPMSGQRTGSSQRSATHTRQWTAAGISRIRWLVCAQTTLKHTGAPSNAGSNALSAHPRLCYHDSYPNLKSVTGWLVSIELMDYITELKYVNIFWKKFPRPIHVALILWNNTSQWWSCCCYLEWNY